VNPRHQAAFCARLRLARRQAESQRRAEKAAFPQKTLGGFPKLTPASLEAGFFFGVQIAHHRKAGQMLEFLNCHTAAGS